MAFMIGAAEPTPSLISFKSSRVVVAHAMVSSVHLGFLLRNPSSSGVLVLSISSASLPVEVVALASAASPLASAGDEGVAVIVFVFDEDVVNFSRNLFMLPKGSDGCR